MDDCDARHWIGVEGGGDERGDVAEEGQEEENEWQVEKQIPRA